MRRLERGQRLTEILKQPQYEPMSLEDQVMIIYAGTHGYCDPVPENRIRQYEQDMLSFMHTQHPEIGADIAARKEITAETEAQLQAALEEFGKMWVAA